MTNTVKNYTDEFKVQVVLEMLKENVSQLELSKRYGIPTRTLRSWLNYFLENAEDVFKSVSKTKEFKKILKNKDNEIEQLQKISRDLTVKVSWFKRNINKLGFSFKKSMVDKLDKDLSIVEQCKLLGINRSSLYYINAEPKNRYDELLVNEIKQICIDYCTYGHVKVTDELRKRGFDVGIKTVRNIRKMLGIKTSYPHSRNDSSKNNF